MQTYKRKLQNLRQGPYVTYGFLAIMVLIYLYMLIRYGTTENAHALIETGANFTLNILQYNEWWRLITAAFIHIGFQHILMNGISFYFLGIELEAVHRHGSFLIIALLSALGGNLMSFAMGDVLNLSAGASTMIFGMFASYIVLAYLNPDSYVLRERAGTFTILLLLNMVTGLFSSGIDNWGHVGGALFGGLATFIVGAGSRYYGRYRIVATLVMVGLIAFLTYFGLQKFIV